MATCSKEKQMENNLLRVAVQDMEEAMQQMYSKLMVLKQTTQSDQETDLAKGVMKANGLYMPLQGNGETEIAVQIPGIGLSALRQISGDSSPRAHRWDRSISDEQYALSVIEPGILQSRRETRETALANKVDTQPYIKAAGFGQDAEQTKELRLNPDWMELLTKSHRALESAASSLGSKMTVIRSTASKKKMTNATLEEEAQEFSKKVRRRRRIPAPVSPHAPVRMIWDVVGLILLVCDAFMLPIVLAWDIESGMGLVVVSWASICFWSLDILANFNTGFYSQGTLDLKRTHILFNYVTGWFVFDFFVVSLDILLTALPPDHSEVTSAMRSARGLRALRAVRLLRLMKMAKFNAIIEEIAVQTSRQWLLMVVSMVKTLLGMVVFAHVLACSWYSIGKSVSASGRDSWLDHAGVLKLSTPLQYMHSLQWLLTPPSPAPLDPGSYLERTGHCCVVVCVLVVMGTALGKFTSALQDLNAMNAERSRKRREVRAYLQGQDISVELIARIMRFVDHKLSLQDAGAVLDISLISPTLQMELYVNQRSSFLESHPLFYLTMELYPEIYAHICGAALKNVFEKDEKIFEAGQFATTMIITALGDYTLLEVSLGEPTTPSAKNGTAGHESKRSLLGDDDVFTTFSGVRWFGESCLFADGTIHKLTLRADAFCDAFTLTSSELKNALHGSPACSYMICEYAKDFLTELKKCKDPFDYDQAAVASDKAVKQNQQYMELHPDPKTIIETFGYSSERSNEVAVLTDQCSEVESPKALADNSNDDFITRAMIGDIAEQAELVKGLQSTFAELDTETGAHVVFSGPGERDRSESSCLSILNLVSDQYENFIAPQDPAVCLTKKQWQQLRDVIQWIAPSKAEVHGVLVLLAIRSLGKSKRLIQQLPSRCQRPEAAVVFLITEARNVVPSIADLDEDIQEVLIETLHVHEDFNFAQLLQGENCPANVQQLKEMIQDRTSLFKFYMMFFIGFMSGLAGGQGSRFLNSKMAGSIIMGCRALRCLMTATPQAIFWSYMKDRARVISIPTEELADLALVRLACLSRVHDTNGYMRLRSAWMSIPLRSREVLLNNFLADGITERAFVLEFLPLCISNANNNPVVRLPALLEVLVDLLDNLAPAINSMPQIPKGTMMVPVDLADMAEFIAVVKNRFIFQSCIMRSKVRLTGSSRICLEMSSSNWTRVSDADSDTTTLAHDVKQVLGRLEFLEEYDIGPVRKALESVENVGSSSLKELMMYV